MSDAKLFEGSKSVTLWRMLCNQIDEEIEGADNNHKIQMAWSELLATVDDKIAVDIAREWGRYGKARRQGHIGTLSPLADAAGKILAMHIVDNVISRPLALTPRLVEALTDAEQFPSIVFECSGCRLQVCIPAKYDQEFTAQCPICGNSIG